MLDSPGKTEAEAVAELKYKEKFIFAEWDAVAACAVKAGELNLGDHDGPCRWAELLVSQPKIDEICAQFPNCPSCY